MISKEQNRKQRIREGFQRPFFDGIFCVLPPVRVFRSLRAGRVLSRCARIRRIASGDRRCQPGDP